MDKMFDLFNSVIFLWYIKMRAINFDRTNANPQPQVTSRQIYVPSKTYFVVHKKNKLKKANIYGERENVS